MARFEGGGGGAARGPAIDRHIAKINSGVPHLVRQGTKGLKSMNLSWGEHAHVQAHVQSHLNKPVANNMHVLPATRAGIGGPGVRNPHSELGTVAEMLTGYKEIEHIRQHPIAGSIALAGVLPIGRVARLGELGVDAARGVNTLEHAQKVAQAAEDASGIKKLALQRRAVRIGRRAGSPEEAHAILQAEAQKATARATKAARKNLQFVEHLPNEVRPETGGETGLAVRRAMKGVKNTYKKQKELQAVERAKRTGALAGEQAKAQSFQELAGAQKHLAGKLPTAKFNAFEPLRSVVDQIKGHLDTLNMLPHDKNRLVQAIQKGINGEVPNPSERKLIESVFGREVKKLSPEAIKERGLGHTLSDIGNIPRALMSSYDLSGAFRQNLAAIFHNPKLVFAGYHQTLHGAVSEGTFQKLMETEVHGDPYFHMAKEDGVPFTEIGQNLNQKEEAVASNWAEHLHEIPGVKHTPLKYPLKAVSAGVRGSDRNYVLLLNRTRIRLYKVMVEQAAENGYRVDGPQGEKLRKQIGDTVATLTGRGNLGKTLTSHRATFNAIFFSPGLMKSRVNLLNPLWYVKAEPFVRQQRLKTALRLYGSLATILYAAKMAGARVNTDPTNADFGKIRVGNTRIDPAGGLTQYMRLVGQLAEGKITSSTTGNVEALSNGPFKTSRGNVIQQFARNKFAPLPGLAYDAAFGPGMGQKLNAKSVAGQMFVPLLMQDMWQIEHAHGPGGGPGMAAATFLPDLFGVGVQNYGKNKAKSRGGGNAPSRSFGKFGGGSSFGSGGSSSSFP